MDIDRELQAALDVDPSPEFVARVRMRIASEPSPRRWGFAWMAVAVGAVAAIVIAIVVTRSGGERNESAKLLASRTLPAIDVPQSAVAAQPLGAASADAGRPKGLRYDDHTADATVVAQPFRAAVTQPEILIDAREAATLRRLIDGVSAGEIDLRPMLEKRSFQIAEPAPIVDIRIEPIAIEPLPVGSEGARQ